MNIAQAGFLQFSGQRILIELRVVPGAWDRPHICHQGNCMRLKQPDEFLKRARGMTNRHDQRRRFFLCRSLFHAPGRFFYSSRAHGLPLSCLSAEPLCMARWSVVSLLIKYCGSSFDAWTVYPLNVMAEMIFFLIVP